MSEIVVTTQGNALDMEALKLINDFAWLKKQFNKAYYE